MADVAELILSCKAQGTESIDRMGQSLSGLDAIAAKVGKTLAAVFTVTKIIQFGAASVAAFQKQEDAVDALNDALSLKNAGQYSKQLQRIASDLQKVTTYSDEATIAVMAQGVNMGVSADQIGETTKAAMGLAAAYKMDLQSAMTLYARASQGQTQMLTRYGIVLDENLSKEQKFNQLLQIGKNSFPLTEADTFSAKVQQLSNAYGDMQEQIGNMIVEVFNMNDATASMKEKIQEITASIQQNGNEWIRNIQRFYVSIETGVKKAGVLFEPLFTGIAAGIENIVALGAWFYENWEKLWQDAGNITSGVWSDIVQYVDDAFEVIRTMYVSSFTFWGDVLTSFAQNWKSIFSDIWEVCKRTIASIGVNFMEGIKNIGKLAASLGENFWDLITGKKKFSEAMSGIMNDYAKMVKDSAQKVAKEWEGFEFGKGSKQFASDVGDAALRHLERVGEQSAALVANMGRNTEAALRKAGTTALPDLKTADYRAWTDPEYIKAQWGAIDADAEKKRAAIEAAYIRRGQIREVQNIGSDLARAAEEAGAGLQGLEKELNKFRENTQEAIYADSIEAIKLQSRRFDSVPDLFKKDGVQSIRNETEKLSEAVKPAADGIHDLSNSIQDLHKSLGDGTLPDVKIPQHDTAAITPPRAILQPQTQNTNIITHQNNVNNADIKSIADGLKALVQDVKSVVQYVQSIESTNEEIKTRFDNLGVSTAG